jgi:cytochrome P450
MVHLTAGRPLLVVSDPVLARQVLHEDNLSFGRDQLVSRLFRRAWGNGLAAAEGEAWTRQRQAAVPAFRPSSINTATQHFVAAGQWAAQAIPLDKPFDFGAIAPRIIARVLFPALVGTTGCKDADAVAADIAPYVRKIARFTPADLLPLPESVLDSLYGIGRDPAVRRLRKLAAELAQDLALADGDSMIARIAKVGPIEDNIRGLLPAAMDTTGVALCWSLWLLARFPDWQSRVAEEAYAAPSLTFKNLPLCRAVVQEAMRLYPPAPLLARSVIAPTEVGGVKLKPGDSALVSIYAMHRHRAHWERPDTFEPERFIGKAGLPDAYLPFGTGGRMCIAAQFAVAEVAAILAALLQQLRFEVADPEPAVNLVISCRSTNGWHVMARTRS